MGMDRKIEKRKWPRKKSAGGAFAGLFLIFVVSIFPWDTSSKLNVETQKSLSQL